LRVGKYGPFLEQGERRASLPEGMTPDELTLARALEILDKGEQEDEPLGCCPETHKPVYVKRGRFGPYVQLGEPEDDEKRNASLLPGMEASEVDLATALRLLSLPRTLGTHPESNEPVLAANGRYGPYVKCGSETRSLPADISPLDVTLDQALSLLAQPKKGGRRGAAAQEPLKVFEASPVTGEPIRLLSGRYGPYVTDGATNASLPRSTTPEDLTFEQAVQLLAERAARGGGRRSAKKKKATSKRHAQKKPAKKTTAKKKASAKKTPKKKTPKKKSS